MNPGIDNRRGGFTLIELLISILVTMICFIVILSVVWTGMRAITRNTSVNLAHLNMVLPMQRLVDDVHSALVTPTLTGTLASVGASSVVPVGFSGGGTKNSTGGKMTSATFATVNVSGTTAGLALYLLVSSTYSVADVTGTYNVNNAGFPVAVGTYAPTSKTINLELQTSADKTLFLSATNGMHLCIPSGTVMLDQRITGISVTGSAGSSGTASTLVATCTLSGSLGVQISTNGTRTSNSGAVVLAYLAAPVNYFVCGTDLIRLTYDGTWEVVMRNVLSADSMAAQATPFCLPEPYSYSPLSTGTDGRRAVTIRMAASNPDYSNNINFRGTNSNMLLYDFTVWSRMQLFDEISR